MIESHPPRGVGSRFLHPLAIASALAVLDVMEEERLVERSAVLGQRLKDHINTLRAAVPQIADVRGLGGMVAVEFMTPGGDRPDPEFTKLVQSRALASGLILLTCGVYGNVIRFLFPLTIEDALLDEGLDILANALQA